MNELAKLQEEIRTEFPDAVVRIDPKVLGRRFGWLDVEHAGRSLAVEWRAGKGFGVSELPEHRSTPSDGLFEGPDQVFSDLASARDYVFVLLEDAEAASRKRARRAALA
jgi:hypothetical protein